MFREINNGIGRHSLEMRESRKDDAGSRKLANATLIVAKMSAKTHQKDSREAKCNKKRHS